MKRHRFLIMFGIVVVSSLIAVGGALINASAARAQAVNASDTTPNDEGVADSTASGSSASAARPVSASGHWSGTIIDNSRGAGTLDLLISQNKRQLSGGFDVSGFGSGEDLSGKLAGQASAQGIVSTLKPSRIKGCKISGVSSSFNVSEIKGTYTTVKCGSSMTAGAFDVLFEHP